MIPKDTLHSLALEIISDNLADCDYHFGYKVISDVMIIWISTLVDCPPGYIKELDKWTFSYEAQEQKQTWDILGKWSSQYWEYYRQVAHEKIDRFAYPIFTLNDANAMVKVDSVRGKILKVLESLRQDIGIRFAAILIVEWARRFNSDDLLRTLQNRGDSPTPESLDVVACALDSMDDWFHIR